MRPPTRRSTLSEAPSRRNTVEGARPNLRSLSLFSTSSPIFVFEEFLATLGLPRGLLSSVMTCYNSCQLTLWLLDNSSSMKVRDSHVVACPGGSGGGGDDDNPKVVESRDNVTRWHELRDCISFHSHMASKCWIRTKLRRRRRWPNIQLVQRQSRRCARRNVPPQIRIETRHACAGSVSFVGPNS